jgi:hypothetical protein
VRVRVPRPALRQQNKPAYNKSKTLATAGVFDLRARHGRVLEGESPSTS